MDIDESLTIIGNGDHENGKKLIISLAERLIHARNKHEWGKTSSTSTIRGAISALNCEIGELAYSFDAERQQRQQDEALDVLAVATRIANREFE